MCSILQKTLTPCFEKMSFGRCSCGTKERTSPVSSLSLPTSTGYARLSGGGQCCEASVTSPLPSSRKPSRSCLVNAFPSHCAVTVPAGGTKAQAVARRDPWTSPGRGGRGLQGHPGQTSPRYDPCLEHVPR